MKKKVVLGVAVVALGALLAVGGTLAWFTDTETATNVITTGLVDISLTEAKPATPLGGSVEKNENGGYSYAGITPGSALDKKPEVALVNNSNDAWVRVQVEATADAAGVDLTKMVYMKDNTVVEPELVDGKLYFYCDKKLSLADGETSSWAPFDTVSFPGADFGNEFANAKIDIVLTAEAIQSDNLGAETAQAAFAGQDIKPLETETAEGPEANPQA